MTEPRELRKNLGFNVLKLLIDQGRLGPAVEPQPQPAGADPVVVAAAAFRAVGAPFRKVDHDLRKYAKAKGVDVTFYNGTLEKICMGRMMPYSAMLKLLADFLETTPERLLEPPSAEVIAIRPQ